MAWFVRPEWDQSPKERDKTWNARTVRRSFALINVLARNIGADDARACTRDSRQSSDFCRSDCTENSEKFSHQSEAVSWMITSTPMVPVLDPPAIPQQPLISRDPRGYIRTAIADALFADDGHLQIPLRDLMSRCSSCRRWPSYSRTQGGSVVRKSALGVRIASEYLGVIYLSPVRHQHSRTPSNSGTMWVLNSRNTAALCWGHYALLTRIW